MKTAGIIAEYNPFHNGHLYQIEETRRQTGADYVVVIMSGDYTQRGTPAIYNKYLRARAALIGGADLILEMPVMGSVAPAADFAECGVSTLLQTGIVDVLSFGSECGDLQSLKQKSERMEAETEEVSALIKQGLKEGLTWPQARARAWKQYGSQIGSLNQTDGCSSSDFSALPSSPNDILATEYLRALKKFSASMETFTIRRDDPGYHSLERDGSFASASAARAAIMENRQDFLAAILPTAFFQALREDASPEISFDDFSLLLNEKLLTRSLASIMETAGMPEDLARKLHNNRLNFMPASELVAVSKNKQYTYTKVNRCLLNLTLGITKAHTAAFKSMNSAPWLRILGFRKESAPLLSKLKKCTAVPVISKVADAETVFSSFPAPGQRTWLFQTCLQSSELYRMTAQQKTGQSMRNEYTRPLILL